MSNPYARANLEFLLNQSPPQSNREDDTYRLLYDILRLRRKNTPTSRAQLKIVLLQAAEAVHANQPLHVARRINADFAAFNEALTLDYMAGAPQ